MTEIEKLQEQIKTLKSYLEGSQAACRSWEKKAMLYEARWQRAEGALRNFVGVYRGD